MASVPAETLDMTSSTGLLKSFPLDATNGAPSLLLGAALLVPLCGTEDTKIRLRLDTLAVELCAIIQRQFDLSSQDKNRFLGFAHGRTGAIYSLLRWADISGMQLAEWVSNRLDELASLARRHGDSLAWPIEVAHPNSPVWTGWCHGSAGHLLTWTIAARVLQRPAYLDFALAAGHHIWKSKGQSGPSLCCGGAGEALSLFELARACGDNVWIDRGLELARQAAQMMHHTNDAQGLFRADVGIALAAAESMDPTKAVWPICQSPL
jgi:lantibiotic modifying enzyme